MRLLRGGFTEDYYKDPILHCLRLHVWSQNLPIFSESRVCSSSFPRISCTDGQYDVCTHTGCLGFSVFQLVPRLQDGSDVALSAPIVIPMFCSIIPK